MVVEEEDKDEGKGVNVGEEMEDGGLVGRRSGGRGRKEDGGGGREGKENNGGVERIEGEVEGG